MSTSKCTKSFFRLKDKSKELLCIMVIFSVPGKKPYNFTTSGLILDKTQDFRNASFCWKFLVVKSTFLLQYSFLYI